MDKYFEESYDEFYQDEEPLKDEEVEEVNEIEEIEEVNEVEEVEEVPNEIEIDGEKYTIDEIKNGMMRQSDYTRKTQELANQRKEVEEAVRLQDFFINNPEFLGLINEKINLPSDLQRQVDPTEIEIGRIKHELQMQKIENEITRLSNKYPDFDEIAVLEKAMEIGIEDLEFVYMGLRDIPNEVDITNKVKETLKNEISNNKNITRTLITEEGSSNEEKPITLSNSEMKIAEAFGMTPEEYSANK